MDDQAFGSLMDGYLAEQQQQQPTDQAQGAVAQATPQPAQQPPAQPQQPSQSTGLVQGLAESVGIGAAQSLFETKDFLFGSTAEEDKSSWRSSIEGEGKRLSEESWVFGAAIPITQFATGMLGAGKFIKGAQLAARGVGLAADLATASRGVKIGTEVAKAAAVGAIAFDPHGDRLSNVIESVPALQNPVTEALMAKPSDSASAGRLKAALESLGMDAVAIPLFAGAVRAYGAVRRGNTRAAQNIIQETADAHASSQDTAAVLEGQAAPQAGAAGVEGDVRAGAAPKPGEGAAADAGGGASSVSGAPAGEPVAAARVAPPQSVAEVLTPTHDTVIGQSAEPLKPSTPKKAAPEAFPPDLVDEMYSKVMGDAQVLNAYGDRVTAAMNGHTFGAVDLPWQKLATGEESLDALIDRLTEAHFKSIGRTDANQAGRIIGDKAVERSAQAWAGKWGQDPGEVLGMLKAYGGAGEQMAARMEVGDALAVKLADEAYLTRSKMNMGNLADWGGDPAAAMTQFTQQAGLAMAAMTASRQMLSGAGRVLRRAQGDLNRLTLDELRQMQSLSPEALGKLFDTAGGSMANLRQNLSRPGLLGRAVDELNYLLVNNLMWGWTTQAVNFVGNAMEALARPTARLIGGGVQKVIEAAGGAGGSAELAAGLKWQAPAPGQGGTIATAAMKQYRYMAASLLDSARTALRTLVEGQSIMDPFRQEMSQAYANKSWLSQVEFKPVSTLSDVIGNAGQAAKMMVGMPVRVMAASDEFAKQITYRSMVMAEASMDAEGRGLRGPAYKAFMQDRVNKAFDKDGRAVDSAALAEAQRATFQQDLETTGYFGPWGQGTMGFVSQVPLARQILPFIKTPTNLIRRGIQYTPGLNFLQREYQEMFTGMRGPEQQAVAFGQLALGGSILGAVATLASHGLITGSQPSNPAAARELTAAGWKPNSIAIPDDKGNTQYIQVGRLDPIGLLFGMVADLQQVLDHPERKDEVHDGVVPALMVAFMKQLGDRTYLRGLKTWVDAISDPDKNFGRMAGATAGNLVPMSSALKNYGPLVDQNMAYMKDVRGVVDGILATIPYANASVAPKRDAFGDPMLVRRSPIMSAYHSPVEQEMVRQAIEYGNVGVNPPPALLNGVDLRQLTLSDGSNAYDKFQETRGHPPGLPSLKDAIERLIGSRDYQLSVDGPANDISRATKQGLMASVSAKYSQAAHAVLRQDPVVVAAEKATSDAIKAKRASANTDGEQNINRQRTNDFIGNLGASFGVAVPQAPPANVPTAGPAAPQLGGQ